MAYITITGGTKSKRKLVEEMAVFALEKLMSKRLSDSLFIEFQLFPNTKELDGNLGDCYVDEELKTTRPKYFTIRICHKQKLHNFVKTVAHELVHVKQYAKGELYDYENGKLRWGDTKSDWNSDYWDQPWEIEAYGREIGLYTRWVDKTGRAGDPVWDTRGEING